MSKIIGRLVEIYTKELERRKIDKAIWEIVVDAKKSYEEIPPSLIAKITKSADEDEKMLDFLEKVEDALYVLEEDFPELFE